MKLNLINRKINWKIMLVLVTILLMVGLCLLAGCGGDAQKVGASELNLILPNDKEEYQNQPLELVVTIQNLLAYDATNVKISLLGLDNKYIELFSSEEKFDMIEGRSVYNNEGGKELVIFNGMVNNILPGAEQQKESYRIYARYNSKIEFSPTICVSPKLYEEVYEGGCKLESDLSFAGQGAPLSVTTMKVVSGDELQLRMTVANIGKGNIGKVTIGKATLGGKPLVCGFRGEDTKTFTFGTKKEAQLVCSQVIQSESSYPTTLFVELFYDYEISEKGSLNILQ